MPPTTTDGQARQEMPQNLKDLPDIGVWRAQQLRLVAFPAEPQLSIEQHWWSDVTGVDPDESTKKKTQEEYRGVVDGTNLVLAIDHLRVQWTAEVYVGDKDKDEVLSNEEIPSLGTFTERRDWFLDLVGKWFDYCPPLKRIGFVGLLVQQADTREAGYELLDRYLHNVQVDPHCTDLLFRVNRKRQCELDVPEQMVNRLCTWSVGKMAVELLSGIGAPVFHREMHACLLEFDVNSMAQPGSGTLRPDQLRKLLGELARHITEIAASGDV